MECVITKACGMANDLKGTKNQNIKERQSMFQMSIINIESGSKILSVTENLYKMAY